MSEPDIPVSEHDDEVRKKLIDEILAIVERVPEASIGAIKADGEVIHAMGYEMDCGEHAILFVFMDDNVREKLQGGNVVKVSREENKD